MAVASKPAVPPAIRDDEVLTLPQFYSRTGMSRHTLKACRDQGLPVKYVGNRAYIEGRAWREFVASRPSGPTGRRGESRTRHDRANPSAA